MNKSIGHWMLAIRRANGDAPQLHTRAKSRGPYPAGMIANCEKMRARKERPRLIVNGATYRYSEMRLNGMALSDVESINYGDES